VITGSDPKRQARPVAGQRFRCSVEANGVRCGGNRSAEDAILSIALYV
jgi:hypothetical protein